MPPYAILSHTWGHEEVSFDEIHQLDIGVKRKAGFRKIRGTCILARHRGCGWAWVDTCCIDKRSSAEFSEAINSMFQWYGQAAVCYTYLEDVVDHEVWSRSLQDHPYNRGRRTKQLDPPSRWFSRGWTLQELIAPQQVEFYAKDWRFLGTKLELRLELSKITGILIPALLGSRLNHFYAAQKLYWASFRTTSRIEDEAYCLLGLFDINLPLIYGEGKKAFFRFQEEILKQTQDQSIFARILYPLCVHTMSEGMHTMAECLPRLRSCFGSSGHIFTLHDDDSGEVKITHKGVRLRQPWISEDHRTYIALNCQAHVSGESHRRTWLELMNDRGDSDLHRRGPELLTDLNLSKQQIPDSSTSPLFVKAHEWGESLSDQLQPVEIRVYTNLKRVCFFESLPANAWDVSHDCGEEYWTMMSLLKYVDANKLRADKVGCLLF